MQQIQKQWYRGSSERVVRELYADAARGLTEGSVGRFRELYGRNAFEEKKRTSFLTKIIAQLISPLVLILLAALGVTLFLQEHVDSFVIVLALVINIAISLFQEGRASRAFEKLSSSQETHATVFRDGKKRIVLAEELVPGDIVYLEAGSNVPADIRLIESDELSTNEAMLTGESESVRKRAEALEADGVPLAEQYTMVWMGTIIVAGTGKGVVVATGEETQIGAIAEGVQGMEEVATPVQKHMHRLGVFLSRFVLIIVVSIFILGVLRGEEVSEMLLIAIAVAVSVVPEGLPAAVTITLAIGMESILKQGGLVRNLLAAETLGSTTTIITDKTGTLTEARMKLKTIVTLQGAGETWGISNLDTYPALRMAVLVSNAFSEEKEGEVVVHGNPIESAIIRAALSVGVDESLLRDEYPRLGYLPFQSTHRFAASLHAHVGETNRVYINGAPEKLLEHASYVYAAGQEVPLTEAHRTHFEGIQEAQSAKGMRFISVGYKDVSWEKLPDSDDPMLVEHIVFVGLLGFADPLRANVRENINMAQEAGARVIVATGDNPITAAAIAREAGITIEGKHSILTGTEVEEMTDEELRKALKEVKVFARVLPHQKQRIAKILQRDGEVVAMTGDGINDAPALKRANIGVAVGSGTDVAKEASDMVLLENDFGVIVAAIREGRRIIDNLKKIIVHILSTSFGEVFVIAGAMVVALPLPILPVQILWLNIIEEGLMSFAFAFEPPEKDVMKRNPRSKRSKNILTGEVRTMILTVGSITGILTMGIYFFLSFMTDIAIEEIRTIIFVALTLDAILFALALKNLRKPFWQIDLFSNRYLLGALSINICALVATIMFPPLRNLLSLTALTLFDLGILLVVAVVNLLTIEGVKYFIFRRT